ncbi:putative adhesin [Chitinivorax sp. B]|uniref:putative adhesin n=1 Tax=Chitinivorax sp. B TaxID=2502235 RepID=UPI0010F6DF12|nr:hypothetical protein [Chitinivorax sp. B]
MKTVSRHKNVVITRIGDQATTALLLSHGGYTPSRGMFRSGSGKVIVPPGMTLYFNSADDTVSIGTKAFHLLQGYDVLPMDTKPGGSVIENYSLEHNHIFDRAIPTAQYDLITISPNGKAHMDEVFEAIRAHQLRYTVIHSFACRINKLTFQF